MNSNARRSSPSASSEMATRMLSPRTLAAALIVVVAHAALTAGVSVAVFGGAMARFDTGELASLPERALGAVLAVLLFPLGLLALYVRPSWLQGLWGYIPLLVNSLLWAAVLVAARRRYRGRGA